MKRRTWAIGAFAGAAGLAGCSHWLGRRAEAAVPRDGATIDVEGARLHYVDRGRGPAIVMVHGLGGQLRNFSYAVTARLLDRYRVILVDRPGSGYSSPTANRQPGIVEQGAIIGQFIAAMELDRPLLVGHSLGGAVALSLALDQPDLLRGLALIAPLTQPQTEVPAVFRRLAKPSLIGRKLVANIFGVPVGKLTRRQTSAAVFAPEAVPDGFATAGGGLLALRPGNLDAAMADLLAVAADMTGIAARYDALRLPVSILFARGDAVLDPERHGRLTVDQIAGAHLELVDGGHMLPITQPDRTASFIAAADQMSSTNLP